MAHQHPLDVLSRKIDQTSRAAVARELGVSRQLITEIMAGRCGISDEIAGKLGFERYIAYRPKRRSVQ